MTLVATFFAKTFHFNFNARTSRGPLKERQSWFVCIQDQGTSTGVGEAAPLPGLSPEWDEHYEVLLQAAVAAFNEARIEWNDVEGSVAGVEKLFMTSVPLLLKHSSIRFAFETALLDLKMGGQRILFENDFVNGKQSIPINGLVWMGGMDAMLQEVELKIRDGFTCIKLKVGGINFEKECDILQYIRRKYYRQDITLRLDANGAFKAEDALVKLQALAKYNIHSIEQPLKTGSPEWPQLVKASPIPIALDEELIGVEGKEAQESLIRRIQPHYLILKPSLHGGLGGCQAWIEQAEKQGIGWWITSALESNVGLNAIAQFTANYPLEVPHGLGTGKIYEDNYSSPLVVENGHLSFQSTVPWDNITP